jgi:hypothetical protein
MKTWKRECRYTKISISSETSNSQAIQSNVGKGQNAQWPPVAVALKGLQEYNQSEFRSLMFSGERPRLPTLARGATDAVSEATKHRA